MKIASEKTFDNICKYCLKAFKDKYKQVGAELCQAQAHVGLPPEAELILSFMEVPSTFSKLF
jgi:hypothetical protein